MAKRYELSMAKWQRVEGLLPGKGVHKRFIRWVHAGVWERVFDHLIDDPDNDYLMLDSILVRVHQQATTGKGAQNRGLGRSRGGLTTKIHMVTDKAGRPLRFLLTPGQRANVTQSPALLKGL